MREQKLMSKMLDRLSGVSVLKKVIGITIGMVILLGVLLLWLVWYPYSHMEESEVRENGLFMAEVLAVNAAPMVRSGQSAELQGLLDQMALVTAHTALIAAQVIDGEGRILASVGRRHRGDAGKPLVERTSGFPGGLPGHVWVALDDRHIKSEIRWTTRGVLASVLAICPLGVGAAFGLTRQVMSPIPRLVQVTRAVRAGDYQARARVRARDELGELAAALNLMIEALQQKEAINRQLLRRTLAAAEDERRRVGRELHDDTGQSLALLIAGLAALERGAKTQEVAELRALATQLLHQVHELSLILRPSVLEDLGLVAALQKLTGDVGRRFSVSVDFAAVGLEEATRLPGEIEIALYRIVQEGLTNAMRHGGPSRVEVLLQRSSTSVLMVIEDDGQGFPSEDWRARCLSRDRLGLLNIEERATLLGGSLRIESAPGEGTRLLIEIPDHGQTLIGEPTAGKPEPEWPAKSLLQGTSTA